MFSKVARNRRISVISLTSLLLVSFCLIPCGKTGLLQAEASTQAGMHHEGAGEMEGHSCHDSSSSDFQLKKSDHNSCLHCESSTPAVIQTAHKELSKSQTAAIGTEYFISKSGISNSYLKWAILMPPGQGRPIHILNSIFII